MGNAKGAPHARFEVSVNDVNGDRMSVAVRAATDKEAESFACELLATSGMTGTVVDCFAIFDWPWGGE